MTNFIDGKRSVLDIYNAVRAECGNLVVGSDDTKFAYVLSPDAPDVDLDLGLRGARDAAEERDDRDREGRAEAGGRARRRRKVAAEIRIGQTKRMERSSYW